MNMQQCEWFCAKCKKRGLARYLAVDDLLNMPDLTLRPVHDALSPQCSQMQLFFVIEGDVHIAKFSTGYSVILKQFTPSSLFLELPQAFPDQRIIVAECVFLPKHILKTRIPELTMNELRKNDHANIPAFAFEGDNIQEDLLRSALECEEKKRTFLIIGEEGVWERWKKTLEQQGRLDLLERSLRVYC